MEQSEESTVELRKLLPLLKELWAEEGIKCQTTNCVFNEYPFCLIKNVWLIQGQCPHFNPKLKLKDVSPGYITAHSRE